MSISLVSIWLIVGLVLTVAELIVPGFVIICFGLAALVVGGLLACFPGLPMSWQIIIFSVLSVLSLWLFRKLFNKGGEISGENVDLEGFVGSLAEVTDAIALEVPGRVSFRGSSWLAESTDTLKSGDSVRIIGRENITLRVAKLPSAQ